MALRPVMLMISPMMQPMDKVMDITPKKSSLAGFFLGKWYPLTPWALTVQPNADGSKRKWAEWEAPYYLAMGAAALLLTLGLTYKPDTRVRSWARDELREAEKVGLSPK
jgi:hypothetical protein